MFFSAYLGTDAGLPVWRDAVVQHARWLGLRARIEMRPVSDGRTLSLGWLEHAVAAGSRSGLEETEQQIVASTLVPDGAALDGDANAATLTASLSRAEIRVAIPPTSPQQFCYARTLHGTVFADDLRLFPRLMSVDVDERAAYALLRYGAIPAPLTLYTQVRSEEHTSELQSRLHLVCRLLLEKKKHKQTPTPLTSYISCMPTHPVSHVAC